MGKGLSILSIYLGSLLGASFLYFFLFGIGCNDDIWVDQVGRGTFQSRETGAKIPKNDMVLQ